MLSTGNPVWAIAEHGAFAIERGLAQLVGRLEAARVRIERPEIMSVVAGDVAVINVQGILLKRESIWTMLGLATSYEAISYAVSEAADEKRIKSITLMIDSPGGEVSGVHEAADMIRRANETKPTFAQVDGEAASAAYWLASQSRKIFSGPGDLVGSIGVRLMMYDFSKLFARDGVEAVPIDSGEFKSAGARGTEITKRHREYFQGIVDDAFKDFQDAIRRGRRFTHTRMKTVGDGRLFTARQAQTNGLIDGIQDMGATIRTARRETTNAIRARADLRSLELAAIAEGRTTDAAEARRVAHDLGVWK
jgi:protease-4